MSVGFTESYVKGRPISLGANIFYENYQFLGQGFGSTQSTDQLFNTYGGQSLFTSKTVGGSLSVSAPLSYLAPKFRMGRFTHLGITYTYSVTDIIDPEINRDDNPDNNVIVTFRQSGVKQSTVRPSITYNTLNSPLDPTTGNSLSAGLSFSGGILGGHVNMIAPFVEYKMFRPVFAGRERAAGLDPRKTRALGFRMSFAHASPFAGGFESNSASFIGGVPLSSRFYLGGDDSIRGYNTRSIAPLVAVEQTATTRNVYAADDSGARLKVRPPSRATSNSVVRKVLRQFTQTDKSISDTSYVPLGGDTQLLFNLEYRIPVAGPVAFVPFADIGSVFNLRRLDDQFIRSEFVPSTLNNGVQIALNPIGQVATNREIKVARRPEQGQGELPQGFKSVFVRGDSQTSTKLVLSNAYGGMLESYRYSIGGEVRVQPEDRSTPS